MTLYKIMLTVIMCFGVPLSGFAVQGDDGIVIYSKNKGGNSEFEIKTSIRDEKIRMDMQVQANAQPVTYLLNIATQSAFKLLPNSKVSEEISWPDLTSPLGDLGTTVPPLVETGKADTIAGYPAEQYIRANENGSTSEFWLTQAIQLSPKVLRAISRYTGKLAHKDLHGLAEKGYFELRKVQRLSDSSAWMVSEVTAIERVPLRDDVFEIPADFKRIEKRNSKN